MIIGEGVSDKEPTLLGVEKGMVFYGGRIA
jgi:hypothetical protein